MEILRFVSGPLIGGIIGYFTNFIAVKMLFYPKKEIKLFGHVLPFTPGAIPKGQKRLAGAVGHAVSDSLLTKNDIEAMLLSDEVLEHVSDAVMRHLRVRISEEICVLTGIDDNEYRYKKDALSSALSQEIIDSIDVKSVMDGFGTDYLKEKIHSKTFGKLISDEMISYAAMSVAENIQEAVNKNGVDYVKPIVNGKLDSIDSDSVENLLNQAGKDSDTVKKSIADGYRKLINDNIDRCMAHIDIAAVIEDKINAMPVDELERLLLSVMKKELNTIVSLGAVIGVLLGLFNNII
jgi:uncharacterized membrane protein YheB (UPF0754 family)